VTIAITGIWPLREHYVLPYKPNFDKLLHIRKRNKPIRDNCLDILSLFLSTGIEPGRLPCNPTTRPSLAHRLRTLAPALYRKCGECVWWQHVRRCTQWQMMQLLRRCRHCWRAVEAYWKDTYIRRVEMPTHADLYGQGQTEGRFSVNWISSETSKAVGRARRRSCHSATTASTACDPAIRTIPCLEFLLRAGSLHKLYVISLWLAARIGNFLDTHTHTHTDIHTTVSVA